MNTRLAEAVMAPFVAPSTLEEARAADKEGAWHKPVRSYDVGACAALRREFADMFFRDTEDREGTILEIPYRGEELRGQYAPQWLAFLGTLRR